MARQYLARTSLGGPDGGLATGVAATPKPAEAEPRATKATAAFMELHPDATKGDMDCC